MKNLFAKMNFLYQLNSKLVLSCAYTIPSHYKINNLTKLRTKCVFLFLMKSARNASLKLHFMGRGNFCRGLNHIGYFRSFRSEGCTIN